MTKIKKIKARPAKRLLAMISPAMVVVTQAGSMDMPQIKMVFRNQVIAGRSNSLACLVVIIVSNSSYIVNRTRCRNTQRNLPEHRRAKTIQLKNNTNMGQRENGFTLH